MDQIKVGKFIAECRKAKNMTQQELADILGITDKAVSKWECGRSMPDISLLERLTEELGVSVNELLSGRRLSDEEYRKEAEENLVVLAENSIFSMGEKSEFWRKKWKKDHCFTLTLEMLLLLACIVFSPKISENLLIPAIIASYIWIIFQKNRLEAYVESKVYGG